MNLFPLQRFLGWEVESVADALRVLATTRQSCLPILDNAVDPDFDFQVYLPSGIQDATVITSRVSECRRHNTVGAEALEGLRDQNSKELLLKAAGLPEDSLLFYDTQVGEAFSLLGSHILALIQAGA